MVRKLDKTDEMPTTGHEWDGIREYDTPMPRWWVLTFYGTIVFSVIYMILFPAIPLINGATPGVLGYSTRAAVQEDIETFRQANADLDTRLVETELTEISADADLNRYAVAGGAAVFRTYCAQCHGAGAGGGVGYPNLVDDAWLWGGDIEAIHQTIAHGIRAESDPDTRFSQMPAFGDDYLSDEEIAQVVEHVLAISGQDHDADLATPGATVFADNCAACHGDQGEGMRDLGAPNLTDAIWLYGGDRDTLIQTVTYSRAGMMPPWTGRLTEAQIRQVSVYVHQLGGGE
ncbi:cytochrome-c oxidase, cbb3-type subunit III [Halovulum dunhuangense]|uniref:Cbb3-type cytochrome c oxidase subunit n=1 Tax=Halovulum dunhuangense TaxID=1505036 RepID=A0A849KUI3_9RHOB|nr:cytochrome-c oxidase, cbb3-type subunit III [Halovulum dunhuangense]NNU78958.1 cytochrome-c oxidase, cbb3-type subunit III [Halovulum dunhuangense]